MITYADAEINEIHLKEYNQRPFRALHNKGVSHHHLHLPETLRQTEEWESFRVKRGEAIMGYGYALLDIVGMRKLESG